MLVSQIEEHNLKWGQGAFSERSDVPKLITEFTYFFFIVPFFISLKKSGWTSPPPQLKKVGGPIWNFQNEKFGKKYVIRNVHMFAHRYRTTIAEVCHWFCETFVKRMAQLDHETFNIRNFVVSPNVWLINFRV